ncbi:hypothetical protein AWB69_08144 [Caballeronia udeis]|uniref:Uncharacterized protein n=1 Tax=Caballeronia udeis TaxID=1232866 RepID=A0A158JKU7_9BURK|nr:hypothetical protein AWB69_08144 [Caballeronia udeis]
MCPRLRHDPCAIEFSGFRVLASVHGVLPRIVLFAFRARPVRVLRKYLMKLTVWEMPTCMIEWASSLPLIFLV